MKKKLLFGTIVTVFSIACATSVFAANAKCEIGQPIDPLTGQVVENYTAGQKIFVPIELSNDEMKLSSADVWLKYDSQYVSPGIEYHSLSNPDDRAKLREKLGLLHAQFILDGAIDATLTAAVSNITRTSYDDDLQQDVTGVYGTLLPNVNRIDADGVFSLSWYTNNVDADLLPDKPEFYALFTVKENVPDDLLNFELITSVEEQNTLSGQNGIPTTVEKINTCDGAFKVVIDNSVQSDQCIERLYVKDGDTEIPIVYYKQEENSISFPVRIDSLSPVENKTITLYADVSTSDTHEITQKGIELSSLNISLNGTVKNYADYTISK